MLEASRTGGSRKALPLPQGRSLESDEARGIIASVLSALLEGAIDPSTARSAGYLLQVDRRIAEGSELEKRIKGLEEMLQRSNGNSTWPP